MSITKQQCKQAEQVFVALFGKPFLARLDTCDSPSDMLIIGDSGISIREVDGFYAVETVVYDYGSRDEPPGIDYSEIGRYHVFHFALAKAADVYYQELSGCVFEAHFDLPTDLA